MAHDDSARVADALIGSDPSDTAAFGAFVRGLGGEERAGLLGQLSVRARHPDSGAAAAL